MGHPHDDNLQNSLPMDSDTGILVMLQWVFAQYLASTANNSRFQQITVHLIASAVSHRPQHACC